MNDITIKPFLPMKGLYYIGQYGTSGYATAAKGYLYHYYTLGIPITWEPLSFDDSEMNDDDPYSIITKSFINKRTEHDMVFFHSTPDLWPQFVSHKQHIIRNNIVIGYCTWETNVVPKIWVNAINSSVHELYVPSQYNLKAFTDSGVTKPIKVVPHIYLPPLPMDRKSINYNDEGIYTFYTIGEMNLRKGIEDLLHVFCQTFTKNDKVRLLVKTHYKDYSGDNQKHCQKRINDILEQYPQHAPVHAFLNNFTTKQINALHVIGDCYISLSRSEGFGLPIFDAHNMSKRIICTGYGGQVDYLGMSHPGLLRYTLQRVEGMHGYAGFEEEDREHMWAVPDLDDANRKMKMMIS